MRAQAFRVHQRRSYLVARPAPRFVIARLPRSDSSAASTWARLRPVLASSSAREKIAPLERALSMRSSSPDPANTSVTGSKTQTASPRTSKIGCELRVANDASEGIGADEALADLLVTVLVRSQLRYPSWEFLYAARISGGRPSGIRARTPSSLPSAMACS